jgi:hypothetical protein
MRLRASGSSIRAETIATTISSGTSSPRAIISLARTPIGVPASAAARSISPVESCTRPCLATSRCACVPLPAPGGPSSINLIYAAPAASIA